MQGLSPVLAGINPGNDLAALITAKGVGRVCTDHSVDTLQRLAEALLDDLAHPNDLPARCRALSARLFAPAAVVGQITAALADGVYQSGRSVLDQKVPVAQ
jgi:hypothetical protein